MLIVIIDIFSLRLGSLWTVLKVSALQVKGFYLSGEPKMVDFLFFNLGKDVKKIMTFLDQFFFLI
jgi:hypothetical protein